MFEEDIYITEIKDNHQVTTVKINKYLSLSALINIDGVQIGTIGPQQIPQDYNPDTDGYIEIKILDNHSDNVRIFTDKLSEYKNNHHIENDKE